MSKKWCFKCSLSADHVDDAKTGIYRVFSCTDVKCSRQGALCEPCADDHQLSTDHLVMRKLIKPATKDSAAAAVAIPQVATAAAPGGAPLAPSSPKKLPITVKSILPTAR